MNEQLKLEPSARSIGYCGLIIAALSGMTLQGTAQAAEKIIAPPVVTQEKPTRSKASTAPTKNDGKEVSVSDAKPNKADCQASPDVRKRCKNPR